MSLNNAYSEVKSSKIPLYLTYWVEVCIVLDIMKKELIPVRGRIIKTVAMQKSVKAIMRYNSDRQFITDNTWTKVDQIIHLPVAIPLRRILWP